MPLDLASLTEMMADAGVTRLYAKHLRQNNNAKQQFYIARGDWSALQMLPLGEVTRCAPTTAPSSLTAHSRANYKVALDLSWLRDDGQQFRAPNAQMILYPKYPEIRIGSLISGAGWAPSDLLHERSDGRVIFLGATTRGTILAYIAARESVVSRQFLLSANVQIDGVLHQVPLAGPVPDREALITALARVYRRGWIPSYRLDRSGAAVPCSAPQCGGYTLEAELGIIPNGRSEPDFQGWEVKQHDVGRLDHPVDGPITLMTPNPDAGIYAEIGAERFLRRYGYPDRRAREDRINFGGIHRAGVPVDNRGHGGVVSTLEVRGFDTVSHRFADGDQDGICLVAEGGEVLARWSFARILSHWTRKHARAVYVPSEKRREPLEYRFGGCVRLGEGTGVFRFLAAVASGAVFYDPAPKLTGATSAQSHIKERHQFRIKSSAIAPLYDHLEAIQL